jgi:hypothetical protein
MNKKDIIKSQRFALMWINKNFEYFNPLKDIDDNLGYKMFTELQLMLFLFCRNRQYLPLENFDLIESMVQRTEKIILSPQYYEQIRIKPKYFFRNGASIIYYLYDKRNPVLESIIKITYKHAYALTAETNPVKKMNYVHTIMYPDFRTAS